MILLLKADDEEQSQRENNCTVRGHSDHDLNLTVTTVCTRDCSAGLDIATKFLVCRNSRKILLFGLASAELFIIIAYGTTCPRRQ